MLGIIYGRHMITDGQKVNMEIRRGHFCGSIGTKICARYLRKIEKGYCQKFYEKTRLLCMDLNAKLIC